MLLLPSADFLKMICSKFPIATLSACQTVWVQIRTDRTSVLTWIQIVCKGYEQTTKVVLARKEFNTSELEYDKEIKCEEVIGLVKKTFEHKICYIFLIYEFKFVVLGAQKNHLIETVLLSTLDVVFG